jgi:molybdate transport system substrate-binding protein
MSSLQTGYVGDCDSVGPLSQALSQERPLMKVHVLITVSLATLFSSLAHREVSAAEVRLLAAVGVREIITELKPQFESETAHKLVSTFDASGRIVQRILAGEAFDLIILNKPAIDRLANTGKVNTASAKDIASSVVAAAVRKGAPRPDISTVEAFKSALLNAKSIARPSTTAGGASGDHITKVVERLGISAEVNAKSVFSERPDDRSNMPGQLVASGRADLALHQLQELMAVPGLDILGEFPGELRGAFMFTAVLVIGSNQEAPAKSLVDFLRTPGSVSIMKAKGMAPAS